MKDSLKPFYLVLGAAVVALALPLLADSPTYTTKSGSGTTAATVTFPADPDRQIRLVGLIGTSDKAASVFSMKTGAGLYKPISNATSTATQIFLVTTNGIDANDVMMLQTSSGTTGIATVSAVETNMITLGSGGFGVATTAGDYIYKMSAATTVKCGAATTVYQGEAIYVGNKGRPVRISLDGTSACSVDSASARYE